MKNVMTRAWEIAREGAAKFGGSTKEYFAEALRIAWAETKVEVKDAKYYENRLNTIVNATTDGDGTYRYTTNVRVWENYGKSRTYFSVTETRTCSKHCARYDFGYFDNAEGWLYNMDDIERDFPDNVWEFDSDDFDVLIPIIEVE